MNPASVVEAVRRRHREVGAALGSLSEDDLLAPSLLPGWSRLTIACHLRYGAIATDRMLADTVAGRPTAFYPEGRERQRPGTLRPGPTEDAAVVGPSLVTASRRLDASLAGLDDRWWSATITEPAGGEDLGPVDLATLALLRLTEVEVHGTDLDLGLSAWSTTFVDAALPARLHWLPARRSNRPRASDLSIDGTWALVDRDGPSFLVSARGALVEVAETIGPVDGQATIVGSKHGLLAFLLGRLALESLDVSGDAALAASFLDAFPAP